MTAKTPKELVELFMGAYDRKDIAAMKLLYEPEAVIAAPNGSSMKAATVFSKYAYLMDQAQNYNFTLKLSKVIESGDIALVMSKISVHGPQINFDGDAIEVARRQPDGNWLYVIDNSFGA